MVLKKIGDEYIFPNFLLFWSFSVLLLEKLKQKTTKTTAGVISSTFFLSLADKFPEGRALSDPPSTGPCPMCLLSEFRASWKFHSSSFLIPKNSWGIQSKVELSLVALKPYNAKESSEAIVKDYSGLLLSSMKSVGLGATWRNLLVKANTAVLRG